MKRGAGPLADQEQEQEQEQEQQEQEQEQEQDHESSAAARTGAAQLTTLTARSLQCSHSVWVL